MDALMYGHPSAAALCLWGLAMLSYHQDIKHPTWKFATPSQIIAVVSLIALLVFGFTQRSWSNFVIVPVLVWLQVALPKRWRAVQSQVGTKSERLGKAGRC
jgi:nitrate reductase gamma subunit